ncbi:TetR/AcrR family transcriptional regulator C-terminal domain-containing protein [Planomonospora venezuelensis]|uniref:AcrR family transcriptional regulator n=1 Tax=Planomonospora venezuelensis TaxID=1999 RepID=A0A841D7R9_PLAVE|nr:TetR/AcrR family transcriptional regulator C-terminal domain-containing protein [Planomonospora venezuelensis]MBB5964953.1 AcrR family transcriptional regulator [Planomonospora venezuelensis]GIN03294.1 transcriptional regulator [Planomonospora venezuelensis]
MTEIPVPPWRKTRRPSAPRTVLSRDLIVSTGLRILDAEGLDALSMRRVAQELGTGPASLYAHVANKEELLDLIYDEVIGEIRIPEPEPERWLEQLRELLLEAIRVFGAHADIARVGLANIPTTPNALRVAEGQLAIMIAGGVPPKIASLMVDRLGLYVCADAFESSLYMNRQRASGKDVASFLEETFGQIGAFYRALPADRFPTLVAHVDDLVAADDRERFAFGLDLMLRGLASYAAEAGPTSKD